MNFWAKVLKRVDKKTAKTDEVEDLLERIFELCGDGIMAINTNRLGDAAIALTYIREARNALWKTYEDAKNA